MARMRTRRLEDVMVKRRLARALVCGLLSMQLPLAPPLSAKDIAPSPESVQVDHGARLVGTEGFPDWRFLIGPSHRDPQSAVEWSTATADVDVGAFNPLDVGEAGGVRLVAVPADYLAAHRGEVRDWFQDKTPPAEIAAIVLLEYPERYSINHAAGALRTTTFRIDSVAPLAVTVTDDHWSDGASSTSRQRLLFTVAAIGGVLCALALRRRRARTSA